MRRGRLFKTVGLYVGLASGAAIAADPPGELTRLLGQPPAPPTTAPPTPPVRPTPPTPPTPPSTTPPGLTSPPTLAPVTSTTGAAPQSLTSSGAGFTPFMMGDLPATSYVCGMVCFPSVQVVNIPPVTVTTPPPNNNNVGVAGPPGAPPNNQQGQVTQVVTPGRQVITATTACRFILVPQVGRGAIKIEENESPRPTDRVYVTYNYFDNITQAFAGIPATNLHRETYGFELAFLDGNASFGMRMSSLQTTGGSTLNGDDFGDVTFIGKYALLNDAATGNVVTVGLAVSAPTGSDAVLPDGTRLNPVLLQPFGGTIYNWSNVYAQTFSSLIIPTDDREPLLGTVSVGLGWWVYRSIDPAARLTYVAPFVEGHSTFALNHRGLDTSVNTVCLPGQPLTGFPDTFTLTSGFHLGLGRGANLAVGIGVPLTGPNLFDIEGVAQLNWRF
jgi:hypothetical protein